jgi:hypothetical protein
VSYLSDLLAEARVEHEEVMLDECTVARNNGAPVWNSTTGQYTQPTTTVYSGICRVKPWRALDQEVADVAVDVTRLRVDLPWTAPAVRRGDVVTVASTQNPWLDGARLPVLEAQLSTTATCQVLLCQNAQQAG